MQITLINIAMLIVDIERKREKHLQTLVMERKNKSLKRYIFLSAKGANFLIRFHECAVQ